MKSLMIKDLVVTEELDSRAMSSVRGGIAFWGPSYDFSQTGVTVNTMQGIAQTQNVFNENGNNVALAGDIGSKVKPVQRADNTNTVNVYGGGLLA